MLRLIAPATFMATTIPFYVLVLNLCDPSANLMIIYSAYTTLEPRSKQITLHTLGDSCPGSSQLADLINQRLPPYLGSKFPLSGPLQQDVSIQAPSSGTASRTLMRPEE
jgi:hypothetical protein